jgi:hypothetical protein
MKLLKTLHLQGLKSEKYHDRNHYWKEAVLLKVPTQEKQMFPLNLDLTELYFLDSRQNPVSETLCFEKYTGRYIWIETERWITSKETIFVLLYHHHKLLDLISSLGNIFTEQ